MTDTPVHDRILLQDVSPRDGLQSEETLLSPAERADLIDGLAGCGLPRVQVGAAVNPKVVPQMAGLETLWRLVSKSPGTRFSVLALNDRGLDQAISMGAPHVEIYVSASETHSRKNSRIGLQEGLTRGARMIERALESGLSVTAGVMCAFGCAYEGAVPVERVMEMVEVLNGGSPQEIGLADTTGMGSPPEIAKAVDLLSRTINRRRLTLHLHDTYGFGMANFRAALDAGIRKFDTSVGGLGGCPFVPGAKGNISTEQAVDAAHGLGYQTGVDTEKLAEVRAYLEKRLRRPLSAP